MAFRKAGAAKIGGKFLVFGSTGSGKSYFGLTFPRIVAIDSETGLTHYEGRDITLNNGKSYNNLLLVDDTSDLGTLEDDLSDFIDIAEENKAETLVIDSESKFYSNLQIAANETEERRARKKGGDVEDATIGLRSWGRIKLINMRLQQTKIDLAARGFHIVSVAQEIEQKNDDGTKVIGHKPDAYKNIPYDYDTVLRFYTKADNKGTIHYYAEVIKDRTNVTHVGDVIENPCYDIWKDYYDNRNKYSTIDTSFASEIESSQRLVQREADRADTIISDWKELLAGFKKANNTDASNKAAQYLKENSIDIKSLSTYDIDVLEKLYEYTKSLS